MFAGGSRLAEKLAWVLHTLINYTFVVDGTFLHIYGFFFFQVFDATNTTLERRQLIHEIIVGKMGYKLFFVESLCDDPKIIESNIRQVKINSPDYQGMNKEEAVEDFLQVHFN